MLDVSEEANITAAQNKEPVLIFRCFMECWTLAINPKFRRMYHIAHAPVNGSSQKVIHSYQKR
ncbi:unnamed protein product [Larinioides sclopetarius]|uniref:Uncharacterized protein n=1 Tax=Larinioides sclopetarius TaxID=280406 RepID=A0AAV1ZXS7_9ARAC